MNAPDRATEIRGAIAAAIAFGTALFGWIGWLVIIWVVAMLLDYLTGSFAAIKNGEWKSKIAREGLWHKAGSIGVVLVAALVDIAIPVIVSQTGIQFDYTCLASPVVLAWYIFTELGSILENTAKLGATAPAFLIKLVEKLKKKTEEDEQDND